MDDLRPVFGQRLRDLRRQAHLSQEEVAHRARLHATYLSDLERGLQTPTLDVVNRLATALKVTLAEFCSSRWIDGSVVVPDGRAVIVRGGGLRVGSVGATVVVEAERQ